MKCSKCKSRKRRLRRKKMVYLINGYLKRQLQGGVGEPYKTMADEG